MLGDKVDHDEEDFGEEPLEPGGQLLSLPGILKKCCSVEPLHGTKSASSLAR
jgi:hypothetical protein